jgi:hypothetical protein
MVEVIQGHFGDCSYSPNWVPDAQVILDDLAESRGNVQNLLYKHVPNAADHEAVLFRILLVIKKEHRESEWQDLISVGDQLQCLVIHAKLLDRHRSVTGELFETKEAIAVLERLMPDVWARKTIQKNKKGEGQKLDQLVTGELKDEN